jgi:hypothetical protein
LLPRNPRATEQVRTAVTSAMRTSHSGAISRVALRIFLLQEIRDERRFSRKGYAPGNDITTSFGLFLVAGLPRRPVLFLPLYPLWVDASRWPAFGRAARR